MKLTTCCRVVVVATWLGCLSGSEAISQSRFQYAQVVPQDPDTTPASLGIAGYAKVLCSAVFVSGRDPDEAKRNTGYFFVPDDDREAISDISVDQKSKRVMVTLRDELTREARFFGDQGCVIIPEGEDGVFFEPVSVETALPDPTSQPWPMGDIPPDELPDGVDKAALEAAVAIAFANPDSLTAAFIVVYRGQIVAERYAQAAHQDMQLESWSMGKSLTATLIGLLVKGGTLGLDQPAPVPAWQGEDDPRREITVRNLLNMSSGLHFIAPRDPDYTLDKGYPDHMYIYTGAIDAFEHSYSKPLQFPPNTEGRYRNSDPLTLGYIIQRIVEERGDNYFTFPQIGLFDKIGIRRQVLEPDPYGNFLLTGYDYGTARNWARLGLLYLWDGVWLGERILPEGWVEFVSSPAPAWGQPIYGGLFWLNRTGVINLPEDTFYMAGGGGQMTFIVPSKDLVIVRMGHFRGSGPQMNQELNEALGGIVLALTPGN